MTTARQELPYDLIFFLFTNLLIAIDVILYEGFQTNNAVYMLNKMNNIRNHLSFVK